MRIAFPETLQQDATTRCHLQMTITQGLETKLTHCSFSVCDITCGQPRAQRNTSRRPSGNVPAGYMRPYVAKTLCFRTRHFRLRVCWPNSIAKIPTLQPHRASQQSLGGDPIEQFGSTSPTSSALSLEISLSWSRRPGLVVILGNNCLEVPTHASICTVHINQILLTSTLGSSATNSTCSK